MIERIANQPAFVLHIRPYRNTSVLLDVLSRDYGRLSLIAKGVKQSKSRLKSILQPYQLLNISWVRRTELGTTTDAEFLGSPIQLHGENLYAAMYLTELVQRLVAQHDPDPSIYEIYSASIDSLNQENSIEITLRMFEKDLLQSLGYEIPLQFEAESDELIEADSEYLYTPGQGFTLASNELKGRTIFRGKYLIDFANNRLDSHEVLKIAHYLTHINLKHLLGERPLKSRELYKTFRKMTQ